MDAKQKLKSENAQLRQTVANLKEHQEVLRKQVKSKDDLLAKAENKTNAQLN